MWRQCKVADHETVYSMIIAAWTLLYTLSSTAVNKNTILAIHGESKGLASSAPARGVAMGPKLCLESSEPAL